jgi:hypothetical protein
MELVPYLGHAERMELRAAVVSRQRANAGVVIDERDPERQRLAAQLLKAVGFQRLESTEVSART